MRQPSEFKTGTVSKKTPWIILAIFAVSIVLLCEFIFLYHYEIDYYASILDHRETEILQCFFVGAAFLVLAICLKCIFLKRVYLWALLLTAVLLPVLCFQFNDHTLKKDGILSPLVEKGGILHFLTIHDFNFDGMNDEEYHRLYEERSYSSRYSAYPNDTIQLIQIKAVGIGPGLEGCFCFYKEEKKSIDLHFQTDIELNYIEVIVDFRDPSMAERVSFYEMKEDKRILHPHTVNEDGAAVLRFSAETCLAWQNESENMYIKIPFQYSEHTP